MHLNLAPENMKRNNHEGLSVTREWHLGGTPINFGGTRTGCQPDCFIGELKKPSSCNTFAAALSPLSVLDLRLSSAWSWFFYIFEFFSPFFSLIYPRLVILCYCFQETSTYLYLVHVQSQYMGIISTCPVRYWIKHFPRTYYRWRILKFASVWYRKVAYSRSLLPF